MCVLINVLDSAPVAFSKCQYLEKCDGTLRTVHLCQNHSCDRKIGLKKASSVVGSPEEVLKLRVEWIRLKRCAERLSRDEIHLY